MRLVLDASMAVAWFLIRRDPVEEALARNALQTVRASGAIVPAPWYAEVSNAILLAERQQVVTTQDSANFLSGLGIWGIVQDDFAPAISQGRVIDLGRIFKLTAYDATYLELAMRNAATLATFDRELAEAARTAGVKVLGDPV